MPRYHRTALLATTALFAIALGWSAVSARAKKPFDWGAANPKFVGATFVNDAETCRTCHAPTIDTYATTPHARAHLAAAPAASDCESCHGPRSKHIENPTRELQLSAKAQSSVCLQCHEGGARLGWKAGAHQANDATCTSCHTVMQRKSERGLLAARTGAETCYACHGSVRVDANKMSHHPVREGKMDCASCHNPHGSTQKLLVKSTVNDTCYTCHAEKRGPFVWEHAPARENCATCHTPHGSNQRNLLIGKDPFLCLSCHSYGGHINLPRYNRVSNPYGNGCSNCHVSVHGSNHPSGAKLTR